MKEITINGKDLIINPNGLIIDKAKNQPLKYHLTGGNTDSYKRYKRSCINSKRYYHHRLIAEALFGKFESDVVVDHINGNTQDNRFSNIRLLSYSSNSLNRHVPISRRRYDNNIKALVKELNILGIPTIDISKSINIPYRTTWKWTKKSIEPNLSVRDEGNSIIFDLNDWSGRFEGITSPSLFISFKGEQIDMVEDIKTTVEPEDRIFEFAKIFAKKLIVNGLS